MDNANSETQAMNFSSDIPMSIAVAAHSGTSFSPEKRGASEVSGYGAELGQIFSTLKEHATKGATLDLLEGEFARLRAGYRQRYLKYLGSKSRILSWMITGPSNFPVRRNEKRSNAAHRRLEDLLEFKARAMKAAIRNLRPEWRPIMAGDADAIERLESKIRQAEAVQERMKAANAAIRKYRKAGRDAQMAALIEQGFSDAQAAKVLAPDCMGVIGFASFNLSNGSAEIRRMKQRVERISRMQAIPESSMEGSNGVTVQDCPAENRVRIEFPGKPAVEIRTKLKRNGFRWTPSLGVWQAYRNATAIALAQSFAAAA